MNETYLSLSIFSDTPVVSIKLGSSLKANDINEGDDVYFECEVRAKPKFYKLLWFKDGKELHQNTTAGIILPGGQSLVLQSVTKASAGEYSCMAANVEGKSISKPVTLEVMCEYILLTFVSYSILVTRIKLRGSNFSSTFSRVGEVPRHYSRFIDNIQ